MVELLAFCLVDRAGGSARDRGSQTSVPGRRVECFTRCLIRQGGKAGVGWPQMSVRDFIALGFSIVAALAIGLLVARVARRSGSSSKGETHTQVTPMAPKIEGVSSPVRVISHPGRFYLLGFRTGTYEPYYGVWARTTNKLLHRSPFNEEGWAQAWAHWEAHEREAGILGKGLPEPDGEDLAGDDGSLSTEDVPDRN